LSIESLQSGSELLRRAHLILKYTHDSVQAFPKAFDVVRRERGAARGATTDEEQDLLRAMVVMAAAGLDSMLKQLIRDALEVLIEHDEAVLKGLETFVARRIRGDADEEHALAGYKFLAHILVGESPQQQVIEEYITHLTGVSLQSVREIRRTVEALGLDQAVVSFTDADLGVIFDARNKIIHELDINFGQARRNRENRSRDYMIAYANVLLAIAETILREVDRKLADFVGTAQ